ncbi:MAG: CDP-glycerol glycerophosphotransferase family protein [Lachnospiraceae bacterium]|nr:CDP-glycerol glycerophosphotransferase family protein [Lachnospiraceae bacterium]
MGKQKKKKSLPEILEADERKKRSALRTTFNNSLIKQRAAVFAEYYNTCQIEEKTVLYEAFYGRGVLCNPNGLFQAFRKRADFSEYTHIWVIEDFEANEAIIQEYQEFSNVRFVEFLSDEYFYCLAIAKYLINNVMFPAYFVKKKEQVYINTWHGIPLKTLGYDQVNGNTATANTIRNFLSADYLVSPCAYHTDIYRNAFKLEGLYNGKVIEEGQPRNDLTIHADREAILDRMRRNGVRIEEGKKIILYAPTWKGQNYSKPTVNPEEYYEFIRYMESRINTDKYQVLVKPHQVVYQYMKEETADTGQFVPAVLDANEVLAVTDILISDYSSIYFDYMVTDRPILFYIPDVDSYKDYRGLYLGLEELPGPVTQSLTELGDWVCDMERIWEENQEKHRIQKEKFVYLDDGESSNRILETVLDGSEEHHVIPTLLNKKKRMLFYIGTTHVNGITETFGSLLKMIDYDKFDVSVIALNSNNIYEKEKLESLNPQARVLMKAGTYSMTMEENLQNEMIVDYGLRKETEKYYDEALYAKEFRRNVGNATFDYVINYTGYSPFYALQFMQAEGAKRYIWQHNDLQQDMEKVVKGKKVNQKVLESIFTLYPYYDKIVACSKSVMETNRKNLSTPETYDKFTYCKNTLNFDRVINGMENPDIIEYGGRRYYLKKTIDEDAYEAPAVETLPLPEQGTVNFVTIGRLSTEKNHFNLIRAFCRFHKEFPESHLYIMGNGLLLEKLQELVLQKNAKDYVKILGNVSNPFGLMKECDCFILPSRFEGQPIVLLEARTVGLPIIVSEFSTVKDSLIPDGQLLIGHSEEDIYKSLLAFQKGEVPVKKFDSMQYNQEAYDEFEALF